VGQANLHADRKRSEPDKVQRDLKIHAVTPGL
jgi:hypothetical protein